MVNVSFQGLSLFLPTVVNSRKLLVISIACANVVILTFILSRTLQYVFNHPVFDCGSLVLPAAVVQAQLRTVPPYAVTLVWNMIVIFWSFYAKQRGIPIIASLLLEVAGYAIAISTKNPHAR